MAIDELITGKEAISLIGTEEITNNSVDDIYLIIKKFQRNYETNNFNNALSAEFKFIDKAFLSCDIEYFNEAVSSLVNNLKTTYS